MVITMESAMMVQAAYIDLAKKDYFDNFISEDELKTILNNKILLNLDVDLIYNEILRQKRSRR